MFRAEAIIRDFSTQMVLGSPVDPLVFTSMVGDVEFQSFMKSSMFISPYLFTPDFQWHGNVVGKELAGAETLWHDV